MLDPFAAQASRTTAEIFIEAKSQGYRLVVAHNPSRAAEQTQERLARIHALQQRADQLAGKLDAQDESKVQRGRKLSDSGTKARFFQEICDAHLARNIKVDHTSDLFTYAINEAALARAQFMDGKLILVTNVQDMAADEVVRRYKALADIERGFRVLKCETEIAPVFHRLPDRIKAHASICFMALILYRVMRHRLKLAGRDLSPEAAPADLRRVQRHTVSIDNCNPIHGCPPFTRARPKPCHLAGQETHTRRPTDPAVVAIPKAWPIRIKNLQGLVSNSEALAKVISKSARR